MKYLYTISTILCVSLYAQETVKDSSVVEDTIKLSTKSIENSGLTQEQIVKLDEQTRILLADYQSTSKEYDSLKLYNDQVQKIINSQIDEIENIILKIDELDQTNQRIVPFMLRMIDGLENFIQLDICLLYTSPSPRDRG